MEQKSETLHGSEGFGILYQTSRRRIPSDLPEDVMQTYSRLRRSITILNAVLETGRIKRYVPQKQSFDMSGELGRIMLDFLSYKRENRATDSTLYVYERMLGRFLTFLRLKGIETMSALAEQNLLEFVDSAQINKSQRVSVLKGLCYYLVEQKLVPRHFDTLIKGFRFHERRNSHQFIRKKKFHRLASP